MRGQSMSKLTLQALHATSSNASARFEPNKQGGGTLRAQLLDSPANEEQAAGEEDRGGGGGGLGA